MDSKGSQLPLYPFISNKPYSVHTNLLKQTTLHNYSYITP